MSKTFLSQKCLVQKILVENDSVPKMFWVQRNLGFKEIEKFGSFKIIAHRFLIKTNVGKILGAERFGCKEVAVASIAEAFGANKILIQKS